MSQSEDYTLFYWPEIPGRAEFIRLCFEYAGVKYQEQNNVPEFLKLIDTKDEEGYAAPHFAVPILGVRASSSSESGSTEVKTEVKTENENPSSEEWYHISQTPAILQFLASASWSAR